MILRLLVLAWSLVVAACVPVPTPPVVSLEQPPSAELDPLEEGEAVAVLPNRERESGFAADCVRDKLAQGLPRNRVLTADQARDFLFPWLEPGQVPEDDAEVRVFMARRAVAEKLEGLRLRYLVVVDLSSTGKLEDGVELLIGGFGYGRWSARAIAQVVDLEAACCRRGGTARATGIRGYAHMVFYGVVVLSSIEEPACDRLSAALVQELKPAASDAH